MKPDWDKLAKEYDGSDTVLIADVDCTEVWRREGCTAAVAHPPRGSIPPPRIAPRPTTPHHSPPLPTTPHHSPPSQGDNKDLCGKMGVRGYPTIKLYNEGDTEGEVYEGG